MQNQGSVTPLAIALRIFLPLFGGHTGSGSWGPEVVRQNSTTHLGLGSGVAGRILEALGTLLRSLGGILGVHYKIEVPSIIEFLNFENQSIFVFLEF